jgi:hypothetical protein
MTPGNDVAHLLKEAVVHLITVQAVTLTASKPVSYQLLLQQHKASMIDPAFPSHSASSSQIVVRRCKFQLTYLMVGVRFAGIDNKGIAVRLISLAGLFRNRVVLLAS